MLVEELRQLHHAWSDMCQVSETAGYMQAEESRAVMRGVRDALETGLVVSYMRAFTRDNQGHKLERDDWTEGDEERRLHDRLRALRNQRYAHTDKRHPLRRIAFDVHDVAGEPSERLGIRRFRSVELTTDADAIGDSVAVVRLASSVAGRLMERMREIERRLGDPSDEDGVRRLHLSAHEVLPSTTSTTVSGERPMNRSRSRPPSGGEQRHRLHGGWTHEQRFATVLT